MLVMNLDYVCHPLEICKVLIFIKKEKIHV